MSFFALSESSLAAKHISLACNGVEKKVQSAQETYAARFCAFRRLWAGVKLSFSSLLLLPLCWSSYERSAAIGCGPFLFGSGIDIVESFRGDFVGEFGRLLRWCCEPKGAGS